MNELSMGMMQRAALLKIAGEYALNVAQIEKLNSSYYDQYIANLEIQARTAYYEALTCEIKDAREARKNAAEQARQKLIWDRAMKDGYKLPRCDSCWGD